MKHYFSVAIIISTFLSIAQGDLNSIKTEVVNYDDLNNVLKFEKFEIGIKLPQTIEHKVANFVSKKPLARINPFLEWELKVTAEFTHQDIDSVIYVDGFYSQEFDSYMVKNLPLPANRVSYSNEEYKSLGGYNKKNSDYNFFVRFAPPLAGKWNYRIVAKTTHRTFTSESKTIHVIESDNEGFLTIGKNKRYLQLGDSMFYPVGGNAPWPATRLIDDPEFAVLSQYNGVPFSENYRPTYCVPRVYDKYIESLTRMVEGGSNSFRMIMYPSCTDIEWEELGNYTSRLHMAQEIDSIVEFAKNKKLIIDWNTQIHFSFQYSIKAYHTRWTWDKEINGKRFCYQKLTGSKHPVEFFDHEESIKYYKQKLRYILARWGYSTNIGIFELMSEINNTSETPFDYSEEKRKEIDHKISKWSKTMADYIKSHHNGREHLLTSSYAGNISKENDIYSDKTMDVMSSNIYDFQSPSFGKFWVDFVSQNQLNDNNKYAYSIKNKELKNRNTKPLIYSETGVLEANKRCDFNPIEMERLLWQSLFSGVAAAFDWDYWSRKDLSSNRKAANFIHNYNLDKDKWHPGAMKSVRTKDTPSWVFMKNFAKRMEGTNHKADLSYLRSGNRTEAIGVITNMTYNIKSVDSCADELYEKMYTERNWPKIIDKVEKVKTSGRGSENLKLKNLKSGKYKIDYYLPNDLENPIHSSTDYGPNVRVEYELGDQVEDYIVIIKVKKL